MLDLKDLKDWTAQELQAAADKVVCMYGPEDVIDPHNLIAELVRRVAGPIHVILDVSGGIPQDVLTFTNPAMAESKYLEWVNNCYGTKFTDSDEAADYNGEQADSKYDIRYFITMPDLPQGKTEEREVESSLRITREQAIWFLKNPGTLAPGKSIMCKEYGQGQDDVSEEDWVGMDSDDLDENGSLDEEYQTFEIW